MLIHSHPRPLPSCTHVNRFVRRTFGSANLADHRFFGRTGGVNIYRKREEDLNAAVRPSLPTTGPVQWFPPFPPLTSCRSPLGDLVVLVVPFFPALWRRLCHNNDPVKTRVRSVKHCSRPLSGCWAPPNPPVHLAGNVRNGVNNCMVFGVPSSRAARPRAQSTRGTFHVLDLRCRWPAWRSRRNRAPKSSRDSTPPPRRPRLPVAVSQAGATPVSCRRQISSNPFVCRSRRTNGSRGACLGHEVQSDKKALFRLSHRKIFVLIH